MAQRCLCFYAKIFGSELALKFTVASIGELRVDNALNELSFRDGASGMPSL